MQTLHEMDRSLSGEAQSPSAAEISAAGDTRGDVQHTSCMDLYLRDVGPTRRLSRQEEIDLASRTRNGDGEAREQLIKANLPLVIRIARAYEGSGVPLLDLISEGNIGLVRAVERFDPGRGAKLSGYGALWIKQAITHALASQSKTIRLPVHVVSKLKKLDRASSRLHQQLGRAPTDEELAAEVGTNTRRITRMRMAAIRPASLDAQLDGEEIGSYAETVADERAESPYEELENNALLGALRRVFQTLEPREQTILRLRFGLEGEPVRTLVEIGHELGLSGERVRQIENAALRKLRQKIRGLENGLSEDAPESPYQHEWSMSRCASSPYFPPKWPALAKTAGTGYLSSRSD